MVFVKWNKSVVYNERRSPWKSKIVFDIKTSFSYQLTFKQTEDRELVPEVNYITVAVVDSNVKVFAVSFLFFLS